jgi:hypothetical protein
MAPITLSDWLFLLLVGGGDFLLLVFFSLNCMLSSFRDLHLLFNACQIFVSHSYIPN